MTIEELKKSDCIIFECISGSRAYGLDTPTSDTDIRGVFILDEAQFYSLDYVSQVNNETNDIVYYELRKFVELCSKNNPNILELLNVPDACVLYKHPLFDMLTVALFLSKKCEKSFGNYAFTQIKKARGLEKKVVNPMEKQRKSVLDFCYIYQDGSTSSIKEFLAEQGFQQEDCGLAKVTHMKDCFSLFHCLEESYNGIIRSENANEVALSSIPKGNKSLGLLFFNRDAYSSYCKKYSEYWAWVEKRNDERYKSTIAHGKNYDAKNMMHTFRLLHMAKEIGQSGTINVLRKDRSYLLAIKAGEFEYEELVQKAEDLKNELVDLFQQSTLMKEPDLEQVNNVLMLMRQKFYSERMI